MSDGTKMRLRTKQIWFRDFRLRLQCQWDLRFYGLLRKVYW